MLRRRCVTGAFPRLLACLLSFTGFASNTWELDVDKQKTFQSVENINFAKRFVCCSPRQFIVAKFIAKQRKEMQTIKQNVEQELEEEEIYYDATLFMLRTLME